VTPHGYHTLTGAWISQAACTTDCELHPRPAPRDPARPFAHLSPAQREALLRRIDHPAPRHDPPPAPPPFIRSGDRCGAEREAGGQWLNCRLEAGHLADGLEHDDGLGHHWADRPADESGSYYHCAGHGPQRVTAERPFTGYAGGTSYALTLACGCNILDEEADLRAAY
jgi:hypothetical protein